MRPPAAANSRKLKKRGHGVPNGERGELFAPAREEQIAADHECASA